MTHQQPRRRRRLRDRLSDDALRTVVYAGAALATVGVATVIIALVRGL